MNDISTKYIGTRKENLLFDIRDKRVEDLTSFMSIHFRLCV